MIIKAISLWQPWASLWAAGIKKNETRSRRTNNLELVAVHAGRKLTNVGAVLWSEVRSAKRQELRQIGLNRPYEELPFGAIVGAVDIVGCGDVEFFDPSEFQRKLGDYSAGRFVWQARRHILFSNPYPCKGQRGWFSVEIPDELLKEAA